jgi:hypothetical protein
VYKYVVAAANRCVHKRKLLLVWSFCLRRQHQGLDAPRIRQPGSTSPARNTIVNNLTLQYLAKAAIIHQRHDQFIADLDESKNSIDITSVFARQIPLKFG